jgi:ABC-type nitrate/sulfonate/bicarbonate transport system substrate-binding protein
MLLRRGLAPIGYVAVAVVVILIVVAGAYVFLTPPGTGSTSSSSPQSSQASAASSYTTTSPSSTSTTISAATSTTQLVRGNLILGTFGSGSVANIANAGQSAEWLTNGLGLYQQQGVNLTIDALQSSAVILQALQSGSIDIADISATEAFKTTALGQANFTAIGSNAASDCFTCSGGFFIIGKNSITSIAQLPGKNIGISGVGGADQLAAIAVLKALGVSYDPTTAINWVPVSTPQARVAGLQQGSLDAAITTTQNLPSLSAVPNMSFIVNSSIFLRYSPPALPGLIVKTSFLKSHTALLQEFVKALIMGNRYFARNQTAWLALAEKARPDMNSTQLTALYVGYAHGFGINGGVNMTRAQLGANYLYTTQEFVSQNVPVITAQQFVNTTLVDNVLRQLGVISAFDGIGRTVAGATTTTTLALAVLPVQALRETLAPLLGKR